MGDRHRWVVLLLTCLLAAGLDFVALPQPSAVAGGWDDGGGVNGAYHGGVLQDIATGDGTDPVRLDTHGTGGFLVQGAIFWTSTTPPATTGPIAELTLDGDDGTTLTIAAGGSVSLSGLYYYRAQLRDTGFEPDVSYTPTGLAADAPISLYGVVDGADAPLTWVSMSPSMMKLGRDPYAETLNPVPAPPPAQATVLYGAIRPGTGPATVAYRDAGGGTGSSSDLAGQTQIETAFPVTRGAGATSASIAFSPGTETVVQLYAGISMPATEPSMSGQVQLVRRGTYDPVSSATPGDELDLVATFANAADAEEAAEQVDVYFYPGTQATTGLGSDAPWSADPATSPGVTVTGPWWVVTGDRLDPGEQVVARMPVTVLDGPGAVGSDELTATVWASWSTRFDNGSVQATTSADRLPTAHPSVDVVGQAAPEWAAAGIAEVTYAVGFNNSAGPDALTGGTLTLSPPDGATVVSVDTVGPLACEELTCHLTGPLAAGHGTTAIVTARVPAPGAPEMSAEATWSPSAPQETTEGSGRVWLTDLTAPSAELTDVGNPFTTRKSFTVRWDGADTGSSGLDRFEVQQRTTRYDTPFGKWRTGSQPAAERSVTVPLAHGEQACVRVRAVDRAGNASAWTGAVCSSRLLDDRALTAGNAWRRTRLDGRWNRTVTFAKQHGASLRLDNVQPASAVAVLVTTCPTCGSLDLRLGSARLRDVNLVGRNQDQYLVVVPGRLAAGRLELTVSSTGRRVEVDGIGILHN